MADDRTPPMPSPPPEAILLRRVRKAARVTVEQAATATGISKAWLSSIENGYDTRGAAGVRPVSASDEIIAALADYLGVAPERLEDEGQRPDAAAVLREMIRRDDRPAHLRFPRDPYLDEKAATLWRLGRELIDEGVSVIEDVPVDEARAGWIAQAYRLRYPGQEPPWLSAPHRGNRRAAG